MTQTPPLSPAAFWDWSVAFYGRPGVAGALLTLQDHDGADVNLLLLLLCLAGSGRGVPEAAMAALDEAIAPWRRDFVEPIRDVRRRLKPEGEEAVRKLVAAAELEAERAGQRRLLAALPPLSPVEHPPAVLASISLESYAGFLGHPLDMASREVLLGALGQPNA